MRAGDRALAKIALPFHDGLRDVGMGLGATALASDAELHRGLQAAGWQVSSEVVAPVDEGSPEVARVIELDGRLARHVRDARDRGAFPLVFAGNCSSCLGTVAGIGPTRLGVVWYDAHADFDTPQENLSGFFDVMSLAILTGNGWSALSRTIPGFAPVAERNVVLAAVRDLEPYQRAALERGEIRTVPGPVDDADLLAQLDAVRGEVDRVYLHLDLDALDTAVGRANEYSAAGGVSVDGMVRGIAAVFERFVVEAAALTAYDPRCDADGRVATAARRIAAAIAGFAARQERPLA